MTVRTDRTDAEQQVASLLRQAKDALGMSVAFLTRLDGTTQHLEVVDTAIPVLFQEGAKVAQETSFCQAILDGRLPSVIPNVRDFPEAMKLPAARFPRLRSYVSVPVHLSDGSLYGTFCATGLTSDKELGLRDKALMEVLASAASVIIEPGVVEAARREEILGRLRPVLADGGPVVVLQPIVALDGRGRVGAEALSRFPPDWKLAPDVVFGQAHEVGVGGRLELLALERAARHLDVVGGYVAMNVSPATVFDPGFTDLLGRLPLPRVLLELSEHDPVEDYDALRQALASARAAGMRLAVDDVGAGFSSLRHIVLLAPDVIKLDRSIVDGLSTDAVLRTLVRSLVHFAHDSAAGVVAEGIETADDAAALAELGVDYGQGWHFGRPGPPEALAPACALPRQRGATPAEAVRASASDAPAGPFERTGDPVR